MHPTWIRSEAIHFPVVGCQTREVMTVATFIDGNHPVLDRCIEPPHSSFWLVALRASLPRGHCDFFQIVGHRWSDVENRQITEVFQRPYVVSQNLRFLLRINSDLREALGVSIAKYFSNQEDFTAGEMARALLDFILNDPVFLGSPILQVDSKGDVDANVEIHRTHDSRCEVRCEPL